MTSTLPPQPPSEAAMPAADAGPALRRPVVIPRRMPMRQARRVSLFEREVRVRLSGAAIEILFGHASILSEGQVNGNQYFGSTMLTIDLARAGVHVSEVCDAATARNIETLLGSDQRVRACVRKLGTFEAKRLAGKPLVSPQIDVSVRRSGHYFHLDVDVEAMLEDRS